MKYETIKQKLQGLSLLILALGTVSTTFFMNGQEFTTVGGIIMIYTVPFGIFGISGIFEKFRSKMPAYANWGFMLFLFGAVATVTFGMRGVLDDIFSITLSRLELATQQHPLVFTLVFFAIGPAYPVSMLLLGINLYRKKMTAKWVAILLIIAAISFPPGRVSRIPELMHLCDLLLALPLATLGISMLKNKQS